MFSVRVYVKKINKMFLPEYIVYIDYAEKTVTVRGCDNEDCDTCYDEYSLLDCIVMFSSGVFENSDARKEIFEGDIVKLHHFEIMHHLEGGAYESEEELFGTMCYGTPAFVEENFRNAYPKEWYLKTKDDEHTICLIEGIHEESFTIIGNIYENPELLEGNRNGNDSVR